MAIRQKDVPADLWAKLTGTAVPAPRPTDTGAPGRSAAAQVAAWCRHYGWPAPVPEFRFHATRRWRFDLSWPALLVAVEFQGGVYTGGRHARPAGFSGDCEKLSEAAALGWRVLPVTYPMVRDGRLLAWLERILSAGA